MRTLYLSDLDGTLLNADACLSQRSESMLSALIEEGVWFSIATARSMQTALPIIQALHIPIPLVLMNGAVLYDLQRKGVLDMQTFARQQLEEALALVRAHDLDPLLYTLDERDLQRIYYMELRQQAQKAHVDSRLSQGDPRFHRVDSFDAAFEERCFYVTTIGPKEALSPLSQALGDAGIEHHFYYDVYTKGYFIECCPGGMNKGVTALRLKECLGADRLVVFGDNLNDLAMFRAADESYAVADAQEEVKAAATGVIGRSDEDGVAEFVWERERGK